MTEAFSAAGLMLELWLQRTRQNYCWQQTLTSIESPVLREILIQSKKQSPCHINPTLNRIAQGDSANFTDSKGKCDVHGHKGHSTLPFIKFSFTSDMNAVMCTTRAKSQVLDNRTK